MELNKLILMSEKGKECGDMIRTLQLTDCSDDAIAGAVILFWLGQYTPQLSTLLTTYKTLLCKSGQ